MQFNEHEHEDDIIENHEMNVTPFIDVMLVLLIIFMVVAPLSTVTVPIELPASNIETNDEQPPEPFIISITQDGEYVMDKRPVLFENLVVKIKQSVVEDENALVYIQADKRVSYEELMKLMNLLRSNGITNIGLVAEPENTVD